MEEKKRMRGDGEAHVFQYGAITFECFANTGKKSSHFLRRTEVNERTIFLNGFINNFSLEFECRKSFEYKEGSIHVE